MYILNKLRGPCFVQGSVIHLYYFYRKQQALLGRDGQSSRAERFAIPINPKVIQYIRKKPKCGCVEHFQNLCSRVVELKGQWKTRVRRPVGCQNVKQKINCIRSTLQIVDKKNEGSIPDSSVPTKAVLFHRPLL